jgi:signal transduction histidine kinase
VRPALGQCGGPFEIRRRIDRLTGLPLRASTVRLVLQTLEEEDTSLGAPDVARVLALDPGWVLAAGLSSAPDPLQIVAERPWWGKLEGTLANRFERLWKHSVATGCAARRLAAEAGDADPDCAGRVGLLHGLGWWALAAASAATFAELLAIADPVRRSEREIVRLGTTVAGLGRELAERWGGDLELADAAWLHNEAGTDLSACVCHPDRLPLVQRAFALAEQTPWALWPAAPQEPRPPDPWLRLLVAEVQVRCSAPFTADDATPNEEKLARAHARLLTRFASLERDAGACMRLAEALNGARPCDALERWAERAALAWCGEPGVSAARVAWPGVLDEQMAPEVRKPNHIVSLVDGSEAPISVQLWTVDDASPVLYSPTVLGAWQAWVAIVKDRERLNRRLDRATHAYRKRQERDERDRTLRVLDALAEFAAGAGHELNNPLAVIVGRAQLLLTRAQDPDSVRSLRAIVSQAQRAHRVLRDMMYIARPPSPRPRPCQPDEVLRASVRDLKDEAEARGVRLAADWQSGPRLAWTDPDPLRLLADVLLRNALEASPPGSTVRVSSSVDEGTLSLTVRDDGKGIDPDEGRHLFDPFYCGRQAGRGLGLGLPRAARIVARGGGELTWRSSPGHGSTFRANLPLGTAPPPYPCAKTETSRE